MERATLYRHFPGKQDLVLAYLNGVDRTVRAQLDDDVAKSIAQGIRSPASGDAPS